MTGRRRYLIPIMAGTVLLFAIVNAHAAQEAASATERANQIFKWINFAIVAGLLAWVFLKLTPPFFRKNAEFVSSAITKAAAAKAEAERQLRQAEDKLSRLSQELAQLRAAAQQEAAANAEQLRATIKSDLEKIRLAANAEIEAAERAARLELKAVAANLAVDRAKSILAQQLTPKTQEGLVSAFVRGLEGRSN